jgi:aminocarboxymuconate-semialdehyde decarboxylase
LPLGNVEAALKELDRVATAKEVVGLTIGSNISTVPLSDPRFEPVWARINALKLPVLEHPLNPYFADGMQDFNLGVMIGYLFDTQLMVARLILNGVFERYPDFPFVVAHTGGGMLGIMHRLDNASSRTPEAKANMKKSFMTYAKNLYFDSCARYAPTIAQAIDFAGPDRIMYGTDYPYVYVDDSYLNQVDMDKAVRAKLDGDTAQRLFKL